MIRYFLSHQLYNAAITQPAESLVPSDAVPFFLFYLIDITTLSQPNNAAKLFVRSHTGKSKLLLDQTTRACPPGPFHQQEIEEQSCCSG
jgi:hypothetical protein